MCDGCYGPTSGHCLQCTGYQEVDDCVEACSSDFYVDELTKTCELCDHQCLECRGPTAADCTLCRNLKLYDDVEDHTADTPVSDISLSAWTFVFLSEVFSVAINRSQTSLQVSVAEWLACLSVV